jgi:ABC-type transporter Mla subunit MlaD
MRRLLVIGGLAALLVTAGVLAGAGGGDAYRVRAIFDSAAFVVKGEDVKVAGVRVGTIDSLAVTPDKKAVVVLDITDPAFQDFRRDATCRIRPQSLIGEQFVECQLTQPRAATEQPPPPLQRIDSGEGKGQYLLPADQTSSSVALDLVADINRLPVRQRLTLILNELGVGLAGRGSDLNDVLRRSAPTLQELDKVLNLLASQNRTLQKLAVDSDASLAPLARERRHVSGFIASSSKVAAATAERRAALEASLQKLPTFLSELKPTMQRLGDLADEMTPALTDLHAAAPGVNELVRQMGPFSKQATPALTRLGDVAVPGIPAIRASIPITRDLRAFAQQLRPVGAQLAAVVDSFRRNDGIPNLMDFVYYQALAVNGFDSFGHFLRAGLLVNTCSVYSTQEQTECLGKFSSGASASAATASSRQLSGFDSLLARTAAALRGEQVPAAPAASQGADRGAQRKATVTGPTDAVASPTPAATPSPAPAEAPAEAPAPSGADGTADLLDYLLGKDGA